MGAEAAALTVLKRGDGGSPETFTAIAEVTRLNGLDLKKDTIDITTLADTWRKFKGTLLDAGQVQMDILYNPSDATHKLLMADMQKTNDDGGNWEIVFPDSSTASFAAIVDGFQPVTAVGDVLKATVTMKATGQPTLPS